MVNTMISDADFIKNPNIPGPTKEEIRCLVMCKSQVSKEDTVVDVGCGTGGLTLEFANNRGRNVGHPTLNYQYGMFDSEAILYYTDSYVNY